MKLIPEITPEIIALLSYSPLQHMLGALKETPVSGMVYTDQESSPTTCVVRIGHNLFCGGKLTSECLLYLKNKILTTEVYEKYGIFDISYPDETWRNALTALYSGCCTLREHAILCLDMCNMNRSGRAPSESDVQKAVLNHLPDVKTVKRVTKGRSTYVYQIETPLKTYYARFLPEEASFAAEVTAHQIMTAKGVQVPQIIAFEHKETKSGLSMMIIDEIPGVSMEDAWPEQNADGILREAGRQLALIHTIPVDGFGWIDRSSYEVLKGEKNSFLEYLTDYLEDDLVTLNYYEFTGNEQAEIRDYMQQARLILNVQKAVLVHGDFDISHIFHSNGKFNGFIDFGEIRGNNRLFDLATFALNDRSPNREPYHHLIEGYREIACLTDADLYAVELMVLFITLRFAGKKMVGVSEVPQSGFWYRMLKKQLEKIDQFPR